MKFAISRGVWVAQSGKCLTPDFGSAHDLSVCEFEPHTGRQTVSEEPAWDSLSPSLSAPPLHMRVHPLYLKNELFKKNSQYLTSIKDY